MSFLKIDNFKIGFEEAGSSPDNVPLIFLHGVGSDKSVWKFQLRELSKNRRVIAFDYAGYGESDLPEKALTQRGVARYILSAMDALNIETAHVAGLSMGGVIALEMFAQSPRRVKSLVLANSFACHPKGAELAERSRKFLETNSMRDFAEMRVDFLLAPQTSKEIRNEVVEMMSRIDKRTYAWASAAVWTADYLDLLPTIDVPTLVIGGELDQPTPPELSKQLAANIPSAKLEIIKTAGHLSNLDKPEVFNRLIENFIAEIK